MSGAGRGVAALCAAAAVAGACRGGGGGERAPGGIGAAAARGIAASMEAAEPVRTPWRCALSPAGAAAADAAPAGWTRDGDRLKAIDARAKLTIAAVAQARGAASDVRAALRAAQVDVVLAIGGMGGSAVESEAALGSLVDPSWLVVAVPGDLEHWPQHAAAVGNLARAGGAIVDGATVRILDTGAAVLATVPGERWPERLAAGAEGCVHDAADLARIVAALTEVAADRPRVLITGPAPQGHASDRAPGGLHAGDPALAALVAEAEVDLVVHAPVGAVAPARAASARRGVPVVLAAGSLDPLLVRDPDGRTVLSRPLIVSVDARTIAWR